MGFVLTAALAVAGLVAACDAGTFRIDPATQPAFELSVMSANVGENKPMPLDGVVQVSFNGYLLPLAVTRQGFALTAVGGGSVVPPNVAYDPVARIVTLSNPGTGEWLKQGQLYRLDINPEVVTGIDGAKLSGPASITFLVGPPNGTPYAEPKVSLCTDILPIFTAKCLGSGCHSGSKAAASLALDTSAGIENTAVGRVANGANTGARSAVSAPGRVFGVDMPVVARNNPSQSWLLYKVIMAPLPTTTPTKAAYQCTKATAPPAPTFTAGVEFRPAPLEGHMNVLRDYVPGREMPFPTANPQNYEEIPLTFQERELVRLWIAQGAETPDCGGCGVGDPPGADAGTDAATSGDAGRD